jgi:mono/diheme cytochrome c family protein
MKRYEQITLIALSILVLAIPVYAAREPYRLAEAQERLHAQYLEEGATLFVEICAACHGTDGAGLGAMPSLNTPAMRDASQEYLNRTIARAGHGTAMAAWHIDEGGILTDYQVEELTTLLRFGDWAAVADLAIAQGIEVPSLPVVEEPPTLLVTLGDADPHACAACHEDPEVHLGQFGTDCSRCHSLEAWAPAQLTRHLFPLDHGEERVLSCQVCHEQNYYEHTCYGCHDHEPQQMEEVHIEADIQDFERCVDCHPTALPGELETIEGTASAEEADSLGMVSDRSLDSQ